MEEKSRKTVFKFDWGRDCGFEVSFEVEITVPRDDEDDPPLDRLIAQLIAVNSVPVFAQDDFRNQLSEFIEVETDKYFSDRDDAIVLRMLAQSPVDSEGSDSFSAAEDPCLDDDERSDGGVKEEDKKTPEDMFQEAFEAVMHGSQSDKIKMILAKERQMAQEVQQLVRARDNEVEQLKREHDDIVDRAARNLPDYVDQNDGKIGDMSASRHFQLIHTIETTYASQLHELMRTQQREYRAMIFALHQQMLSSKCDDGQKRDNSTTATLTVDTKTDDLEGVTRIGLEKVSPGQREAKMNRDESFTIYLGAQLKTMHNLRLLSASPTRLLCRSVAAQSVLDESQRLQMSLSLYGTNLAALLLLVDSRPRFHCSFRTEFAKCCEQSTEFHFPLFETQLEQVAESVGQANSWRQSVRDRKSIESDQRKKSEKSPISNNQSDDKNERKVSTNSETLQVGDVYITRHSNLAQIHIAFHMVTDEALRCQDISSRHPCINGLRNIIRLCAKYNVSTITIPLLLVDKMSEEMTLDWCLKRAELVLKCVKGFVMEVCSLGSSAPGNDHQRHSHFNIQFIVPTQVSDPVYGQLADMFPTIFHLVNPVVAPPK